MATTKQVQAAKHNVKKKNIAGRSKMGKWELIDAIRRAG